MTTPEVAEQVKSLATAWEEFKSTNDARLKEVEKRGAADPLLTGKLETLNAALDEAKTKIDAMETALARTHKGGEGEKATVQEAEYKAAFIEYMRKGTDTKLQDLQQKAMSVGSDPDGGYWVRPEMSSKIITIIRETSPVRQVASVQSISTDALEMMEDRGLPSSGWIAETQAPDEATTPKFGLKNIPVHEMYAQPKATRKLLDDASIDIEGWLAGKIAEAFSLRENGAFVTGDGVGKPRGLLTYAAGTNWGQIEQVGSGTNGTFDGDDLMAVLYRLKGDYMSTASWMMNRQTELAVRLLKDLEGRYIWQPGLQAGTPPNLLERPLYRADDFPVPGTGTLSIMVGDFRRAYQIVDRLGIRTLRDEYTDKPHVKFYTTKRVGGDVINFEALKILKLA